MMTWKCRKCGGTIQRLTPTVKGGSGFIYCDQCDILKKRKKHITQSNKIKAEAAISQRRIE